MKEHDDDVERMLRRYRPVAPAESLRARIEAQAPEPGRRQRLIAWLPAAAALAAAALLHMTAFRMYADLGRETETAARQLRDAQLESLTEAFGGGERGRREAERTLAEVEASRASVPANAPPAEGVVR